ncbi:SCO family protein [Mesobacillus zeae]|uniref:SCO family protein n=1 Tax=Mesobacillus zeae TaxID=1917180 RepID=A0A398BCS6_9BACI|nr:SCO family protein [Mesobacillus zeae]RID85600.1 SCO family protein [Mesobacillus zeae]
MKKVYIISAIIVFIGISAGISFFLARDAQAKIPDKIELVNQDGEYFKFGDAKKKLKLVEFIYTHCPDICPTTTQKMNLLRKDLEKEGVFGKDIQFITITIDPYRDQPDVLKKYMHDFEVKNDGNWQFLTGRPQQIKEDQKKIKEVADTFKFQYRDPGNGFYVHSSFTYLIDENNQFMKKFPMGEEFDKNEVFEEVMDEL